MEFGNTENMSRSNPGVPVWEDDATTGNWLGVEEIATDKDLPIKIEGLNVERGLMFSGGVTRNYLSTLAVFQKEAWRKIEMLKLCLETKELSLYRINVHALKGALANIGAQSLSEDAFRLETAARTEDIAYIQAHSYVLFTDVEALSHSISKVVATQVGGWNKEEDFDQELLKTGLADLKTALSEFDHDLIKKSVRDLKEFAQAPYVGNDIENILQNVLVGEYDGATELIMHAESAISELIETTNWASITNSKQ
ncbi:MAG: Hpt domain-containing protein [Peptococcaceae bacterium]|nr:Hpt domain-containing protein [Peptococcaceae bacterium]